MSRLSSWGSREMAYSTRLASSVRVTIGSTQTACGTPSPPPAVAGPRQCRRRRPETPQREVRTGHTRSALAGLLRPGQAKAEAPSVWHARRHLQSADSRPGGGTGTAALPPRILRPGDTCGGMRKDRRRVVSGAHVPIRAAWPATIATRPLSRVSPTPHGKLTHDSYYMASSTTP